jgi:acetyl esterase
MDMSMDLHPLAASHLAQRQQAGEQPFHHLEPDLLRAQGERLALALAPSVPGVASVHALTLDTVEGPLGVRVYRPNHEPGLPLLIMYHGGGWVMGTLRTYDAFCRQLCLATGCVVVSADYRKAPEFRYPTAAHDAYAVMVAAVAHAAQWGADARRVAVGGTSAGANLAAVVALMARDRQGPRLSAQVLIVPVTDARCASPSYSENAYAPVLPAASMRWFWEQYLPHADAGLEPYASPLYADLSGLPDAIILAAQYDPLRDEAMAYGQALQDAGVTAEAQVYEGMIHSFLGPRAMADIATFLGDCLR